MTPTILKNLRPLTLDEVQRLLAAARGHPDEALLIVALATGLRRGELLAVQWQDVDPDQGTLAVRRTLRLISRNEDTHEEPKTGHRDIVLPGLLIVVLQQHRTRQDDARQAAGTAWQERALVFPAPSGTYRRPDDLSQSVQEIARAADIPLVSFHALRQTTASILISLGVPVQVIQDILGMRRATLPLTLSASSFALHREAAAKLDALFRTLVPGEHVGLSDSPRAEQDI